MRELELETAMGEIHQVCEDKLRSQSPFFLIVGAGISSPPLPLASKIQAECKAKAKVQSDY